MLIKQVFAQFVNKWKAFLSKGSKPTYYLGLLFISTVFILYVFTLYLDWNETRNNGYIIEDFILVRFTAINVSIPIFLLTYIGVISGLIHGFRTPKSLHLLLWSAIMITLFRCISLYFVPLVEPVGIIPLRDFVLEGTFYSGKVIKKDLFFSGHTANVFILGFMTENIKLKKFLFILGSIIGILLLVQKAHYTIDVIAAPIFAYLGFLLASKISQFIGKKFFIDCL